MTGAELSFGLYYDFRVLDPEPRALTTRWQGILDQVCWAETLGFRSVWVSEHHFLPDNYASSTLALLSALAVRTERMWLGTNVLVLPVHDPLRLADGFVCVLPAQIPEYVQARRALGLDDGRVAVGNQWIVAPDPERTFAAIAEHVLYQVNKYIEYGAFGPPELVPRLTEPQQVIDQGHYRLLDAAGAADELVPMLATGPVVDCFSWTLFPGETLDSAAERLEYMAGHFFPEVRRRLR